MKSVARRKQQQEDLRARILDAARALRERGVEAVSMGKVADKIGYSATTLYNHFDDKEALLYALCDADFGTLHEMFKKVGKIADPVERLRKMGETYITFALRYPSHYRFMFMTPRVQQGEEVRCEIERGNPDKDSYAFVCATVAEASRPECFAKSIRTPICFRRWFGVQCMASHHCILS